MYNILVVDDERIHREGLIMLLEKICPDDMLWEASNGQEAMEIMNNISCEIVISDIRMAEMDGLQLQKKVKTDYPETAFVIVSGYADFSYAREALQFHASDYLLKPVDAEELKRAIKKIKKSKNQDQVQKQKVDQMERRLKESAYGYMEWLATVYKGNIIKNLIMDCQSYTKYRPNETTGGIFVSWRRKEELPTGA